MFQGGVVPVRDVLLVVLEDHVGELPLGEVHHLLVHVRQQGDQHVQQDDHQHEGHRDGQHVLGVHHRLLVRVVDEFELRLVIQRHLAQGEQIHRQQRVQVQVVFRVDPFEQQDETDADDGHQREQVQHEVTRLGDDVLQDNDVESYLLEYLNVLEDLEVEEEGDDNADHL